MPVARREVRRVHPHRRRLARRRSLAHCHGRSVYGFDRAGARPDQRLSPQAARPAGRRARSTGSSSAVNGFIAASPDGAGTITELLTRVAGSVICYPARWTLQYVARCRTTTTADNRVGGTRGTHRRPRPNSLTGAPMTRTGSAGGFYQPLGNYTLHRNWPAAAQKRLGSGQIRAIFDRGTTCYRANTALAGCSTTSATGCYLYCARLRRRFLGRRFPRPVGVFSGPATLTVGAPDRPVQVV